MADKSNSKQSSAAYPEGEKLRDQVSNRQRRGFVWQMVFVSATMVGIVALVALLYNILNSAFGYVAIQNSVVPEEVVVAMHEDRMLSATNVASSENDVQLANRTANNPYAVAFFGYSYYQRKADELRVVPIDGMTPTEETVHSGEYFLSRPLYFYTSEETLQEKPEVREFVQYYVDNVNNVIEDVGYFASPDDVIAASAEQLADIETAEAAEAAPIEIVGSSTVFPLTREMAKLYEESGATTEINLSSTGSSAGIALFCNNKTVDITNASRSMVRSERDICQSTRRTPVEFRVGTDAIAVVVSQENDFVDSLTLEETQLLFTSAELWSDVNPDWPDEPITRFIPSIDSGTLDFFTSTVFDTELDTLSKPELISILEQSPDVSVFQFRQLDSEMPFAERTREDVLEVVYEWVIAPEIVDSWDLYDSLLNRGMIETEVSQIDGATLTFRNWLTLDFLSSPQSSTPEDAGIRTAIFGSLWVILITLLFSLPLGVGAAIYLEEYAHDNWFNRIIETNINNLAGVPSIIYGMLGLAIFVRTLEALTSGRLFGVAVDPTTANGRTILSAGLTLGLLILPIIIINAREAIRAVPASLRQASFGLGATRWQTIWNHVLPTALPGILTGNILAMSRAIGETAPLVVIGASTTIFRDPTGPFSKFTTLPIQIYQWTARPQAEFRHIAAAAIVVLLILLLTLNASAVLLRNRYSTKSA